MIRRPPGSTQSRSSAASDVYNRQRPLMQRNKHPVPYQPREHLCRPPHPRQCPVDPISELRHHPDHGAPKPAVEIPGGNLPDPDQQVSGTAEQRELSLIHISEPTRPN
eukprot:TRINITY_DN24128_c0_g1_i1.p2 TRINITY_DN24128_c0_g1~~TRINITY_DN24128_c0_g1_i1.p2  ORF type:complete len:108 (+),score=27.06 TRINITY_DN24128_c0_g1_i1:52-375(+)